MTENGSSFNVRKGAFAVHIALGPGLLELVYETALAYALRLLGYDARTQMPLPMTYAGQRIAIGFRLDLLVNKLVFLDIKSLNAVLNVHKK